MEPAYIGWEFNYIALNHKSSGAESLNKKGLWDDDPSALIAMRSWGQKRNVENNDGNLGGHISTWKLWTPENGVKPKRYKKGSRVEKKRSYAMCCWVIRVMRTTAAGKWPCVSRRGPYVGVEEHSVEEP